MAAMAAARKPSGPDDHGRHSAGSTSACPVTVSLSVPSTVHRRPPPGAVEALDPEPQVFGARREVLNPSIGEPWLNGPDEVCWSSPAPLRC